MDERARFEDIVDAICAWHEEARASKVFSMPCVKRSGKVVFGLSRTGMVFKLTDPDVHRRALALPGAHLFDPSGRGEAFRQWVLSRGLRSTRHTYERTRPNGTVLEIRTVPLPDGGAVRTYTDITSRKTAEIALEEAKGLAEAARGHAERVSQAKSEFLASMSHEIRTPLNGILGFTDLMIESGGLEPQKLRYAERIRSAGLALLTVVDDILDFSKIEAGHIELEERAFCLRTLTDNSISIFTIDAMTGRLTRVGYQRDMIIYTWHFAIDGSGQFMIVANNRDASVLVNRIDQQTGTLQRVGMPVTVAQEPTFVGILTIP